jgi:mannose-6-phosphate isomerase-like protein (cupin superfamily)
MFAALTRLLPTEPDVVAPDGSFVRVLLSARGGSLAHFELPAGETSTAVVHQTVDELWFVLSGAGELWRRHVLEEAIVPLSAGVCVGIPVGTQFQFRAGDSTPLRILGVTMPPWPGGDEARRTSGCWTPTVPRT